MKKIILTIVLVVSALLISNYCLAETSEAKEYKGKVLENISVYYNEQEECKYQKVIVEIHEKEFENRKFEAQYLLKFMNGVEARQLQQGDTVYLLAQDGKVIVKDLYRINYLFLLVVIFAIIVIIIGGIKGIKTMISLSITFFVIFFGVIPLILRGNGAMFISVIACIVITIATLLLVSGIHKKTFVAMIGTITGVLVALIFATIFSNLAGITGLGNDEAQMLVYQSQEIKLDIYGLFFAGILIATVGATMDITMSISSAMNELELHSNKLSWKELFHSGLNVGKDAMGTMSNTLILAYIGESLNLVILILLTGKNVIEMVNYDFIAAEILRSLCGTIGMISAIPLTAFIYAMVYKKRKGGEEILCELPKE